MTKFHYAKEDESPARHSKVVYDRESDVMFENAKVCSRVLGVTVPSVYNSVYKGNTLKGRVLEVISQEDAKIILERNYDRVNLDCSAEIGSVFVVKNRRIILFGSVESVAKRLHMSKVKLRENVKSLVADEYGREWYYISDEDDKKAFNKGAYDFVKFKNKSIDSL